MHTLNKTILKHGPGIPLVFFHGFLGTASDWQAVCSHLPPSHCIGFDLPGHGGSPFITDFKIEIPLFHLIGYSMGGRIALHYAKKHPEQIASLTLLSTHPGLEQNEEKQKRLEKDEEWARKLQTLPIHTFLKLWYAQPLFAPFCPDLTTRAQQNPQLLAKASLHYSLAKQTRYNIQRMIVGERDTKFRALISNPIVIPESGHAVHLENPKAVANAIAFEITHLPLPFQ